MRKADYTTLANILNQDIRHSVEFHDWHLSRALHSDNQAYGPEHHKKEMRYYEKRKAHTIDLSRAIARNISVNQTDFLKACGIE